PGRVDRTMPGDREQPTAEAVRRTDKRREVADDLQPGLRRDVLVAFTAAHPQVAEQPRLQRTPQLEEPGLVTAPGATQSVVERLIGLTLLGARARPMSADRGVRSDVSRSLLTCWEAVSTRLLRQR